MMERFLLLHALGCMSVKEFQDHFEMTCQNSNVNSNNKARSGVRDLRLIGKDGSQLE